MATVSLDESIEAVCFLDFLTGNLGAATVSKMNGQFVAFWGCNVNKDLGVDPAKSPRYMMVSGNADLRRVGGAQSGPSRGIIYVAEVTSGKVGAYCIPWSPAVRNQATPARGQIKCLDVTRFRTRWPAAAGSDAAAGACATTMLRMVPGLPGSAHTVFHCWASQQWQPAKPCKSPSMTHLGRRPRKSPSPRCWPKWACAASRWPWK